MKVLVVEDEEEIQEQLAKAFQADDHDVVTVSTAEEAMRLFQHYHPEVYMLDDKLPGLSGRELCRWLRDQGVKEVIVMLSAHSALSDRIDGLDSGADDYLTKPFEISELRARLRAFERKERDYPRPVIALADLALDPNEKTVRRGASLVGLSKKEYQLLEYLVCHRDQVVTRSMIAAAVWNSNTSLYTNVIDSFIANLRRKIDHGTQVTLIHTVRGKGFVLSETFRGKAQ